ncbi:ParB/RepB/Spo0J family partition protein [Spiroplasma endosymbiont of Crioceris asparagi]|uniref:ParB/RepB/Spo0J family partition protein n=1 Tax=Spiroplasma endosymbiont of Crioceris asparagi TaxID=3066286 RepID=UPI0030D4C25C
MAANSKYKFKGISDLLGNDAEDILDVIGNNPKLKIEQNVVELKNLIPNPYQPRKTFDELQIQELADSIKEHGLIQPILVKKIDSERYQVVAGERRFRAAKVAGLKELSVVVLELTDLQVEELAIIENIQRVDLSDIEEAIAYNQLAKKLNLTQEQVAKRIKKSRSYVANIMRLLNLPDYIQKAILGKKISTGQARPLITIVDNKELTKEIFNTIIAKNLSARQAEALVKFRTLDKKGRKKINKKDADVKHLEKRMMKKLGTKVVISDKKIEINYIGVSDLNRILEILDLLDE